MLHTCADQQRPEKGHETVPFAAIDHHWENGQKQSTGVRGRGPVPFAKVLEGDQVQERMPEPES